MHSNGSSTRVSQGNYREAETTTEEDSDSCSDDFSSNAKGILFSETFKNIKNLLDELGSSLRISRSLDNNLLLRYNLAQVEKENLSFKISNRCRNLTSFAAKKLSESKYTSCSDLVQIFKSKETREIDILYKTIEELEDKVKCRENTIGLLCHKYLYLKNKKDQMENNFKEKIYNLENLLHVTRNILHDVQKEYESKIENYLSQTRNTYEALFLQEKWRCNKLMYENIRLLHEVKRLQDNKTKNTKLVMKNGEGYWKVSPCVDKSTSEPFMKHF